MVGGIVAAPDGPGELLDTAELWDPATEAFVPAGRLTVARTDHTADLLEDGSVLVTGGMSERGGDQAPGAGATAERWMPSWGVVGGPVFQPPSRGLAAQRS